jgi:prepilin-type N-terminal cleavage/methylation domain-containing protein
MAKPYGFTLPEVMLAMLLLSFSLPAMVQLLGHVGSVWPRVNYAYQEEQQLQQWLQQWQHDLPASVRTGQFYDGRNWRIEYNGNVWFWQVSASAYSAAEQGWYLPNLM